MIDFQILMTGILLVSILTSLTTEAIKKLINDETKSNNLIAVGCSIVLSIAVSVCYVLLNNLTFTNEVIISTVIMVFFSFLCSTLGYDKVIQTLAQMKKKDEKKDDQV